MRGWPHDKFIGQNNSFAIGVPTLVDTQKKCPALLRFTDQSGEIRDIGVRIQHHGSAFGRAFGPVYALIEPKLQDTSRRGAGRQQDFRIKVEAAHAQF